MPQDGTNTHSGASRAAASQDAAAPDAASFDAASADALAAGTGGPVPLAALEAAEGGAVVARLPVTAAAAVGEDAAAFVHGQLANDVSGLPVGGVNQSLSLNHRGHALAEGSVLRRGKTELLLVFDDRAEGVVQSLEDHIIFDQVTLERLPDLALVTLQGGGAAALLPVAPATGTFARGELAGVAFTVYPRRRSAPGGFDLVVSEEQAPVLVRALEAAGALAVPAAVIDALRVRGLVPTAAGEGGEGVLPQEAGLEGSLSYRKGCYLGQEIMARIEARGKLRRSLARLVLEDAPVLAGAERPITAGGRTVGRLGSVVALAPAGGGPLSHEALAVLRDDLPEGTVLEVGGTTARRA